MDHHGNLGGERLSINPLRPYHSNGYISARPFSQQDRLYTQGGVRTCPTLRLHQAKSEPAISTHKSHPLLDSFEDTRPHTYNELILAAETLENIVNEGTFVGSIRSRYKMYGKAHEPMHSGREMSDQVLKLVYGTMKFLPYIDQILVKTQFLVFNNQFLDHLALIKVLLYDLMKYHYEYTRYPGIQYDLPDDTTAEDQEYQQNCVYTVRQMDEALRAFQVKLGAAYARLRIEKRASGDSSREQMENILPIQVRERELIAVDMSKTLRINTLKTTMKQVTYQLEDSGFQVVHKSHSFILDRSSTSQMDKTIYIDDDLDDVLVIPASLFGEIKAGPLVGKGHLIFQDKASLYGLEHLKKILSRKDHVIDARAGCGIKAAGLSSMVGDEGCIYAFENRSGRLETLTSNMKLYGCTNTVIVQDDFARCDTQDPRYSQVSVVFLEPPNSGTAIVDKLGFMLQEEEFPNDEHSLTDLYSLKHQQVSLLKHAFKFPNVKTVMYMSRSVHPEENEQVIQETLDRYGVEWELSCVSPIVVAEEINSIEMSECLVVHPSEQTGNGVFLACFQKKPSHIIPEDTDNVDPDSISRRVSDLTISEMDSQMKEGVETTPSVDAKTKKKRKNSAQRQGKVRTTAYMKLPRGLSESVNRLSIPRAIQLERKQHRIEQLNQHQKLKTHDERSKNRLVHSDPAAQIEECSSGKEDNQMDDLHEQMDLGSRGSVYGYQCNDISIFGSSLTKFYGPRMEAIKKLEAQEDDLRWKYPVPNPRAWK
ncbi:hypothetical protein BASA61_009008 [Batrachochytrium salamandrivorans]|nr:hypothetical protein BASA61_009008 [Batrachochytrium salamandrivorans]KAH9250452.1 hypothetical protein BASA81_011738 [Batrachochytrium salamandrivorans]